MVFSRFAVPPQEVGLDIGIPSPAIQLLTAIVPIPCTQQRKGWNI